MNIILWFLGKFKKAKEEIKIFPPVLIRTSMYHEYEDGRVRRIPEDSVRYQAPITVSAYWEGKPVKEFGDYAKKLQEGKARYDAVRFRRGAQSSCCHGHIFDVRAGTWGRSCSCGLEEREYLLSRGSKDLPMCPDSTEERCRMNYNGETVLGNSINFLSTSEIEWLRNRMK